jgi:hypothetical protein
MERFRLTRHARKRARARHIPVEIIAAVYADPDGVRPSGLPDREVRSRRYDWQVIEVVVDVVDGSVVSVWARPAR